MSLVERILESGLAKVREIIQEYAAQARPLPHMMWAFTTDPTSNEQTPYRFSMVEIPAFPVEIAVQQRIVDQLSEDLAINSWQYRGGDLQVALFVGPFWPYARPGVVQTPEFPTIIIQTWMAGMGTSTVLYPTVWDEGRLVDLQPPQSVLFTGEVYAARFAHGFQGLAGVRRN